MFTHESETDYFSMLNNLISMHEGQTTREDFLNKVG